MTVPQTTLDLLDEFERLIYFHARKMCGSNTSYQSAHYLDVEDYAQAAKLGLIEAAHEVDGLEGDERVKAANRIIKRYMSREASANSWVPTPRLREQNPLVSSDYELNSDGITAQDLFMSDRADEINMLEWMLTFEAELPPRTFEMIKMRLAGATYQEIGDHYGITNVSAWQAIERGILRLGLTTPRAVYEWTFRKNPPKPFDATLKEECEYGHSLDDAYTSIDKKGRIKRHCRTCKLERMKAKRDATKLAATTQ